MNVTVVDNERELDGLEAAWDRLAEKASASYFSSFYFVRTAWRHFHKPGDRLAVLVVADGATPVGIVPFFVTRTKKRGIPCRALRFINMWQGDRPEIIADGDYTKSWREIVTFLLREFSAWDVLELSEQPADGPLGAGWSFLLQGNRTKKN